MMTTRSRMIYKVAVYWRDDDGVWHHHGSWQGEAANPADAKRLAIDELEDAHLETSWKAEILASKPVPKAGR